MCFYDIIFLCAIPTMCNYSVLNWLLKFRNIVSNLNAPGPFSIDSTEGAIIMHCMSPS